MPNGEPCVDQLARGRGEVPDVGGAAALVVDDRNLVPLGAEPEHRAHEVVARLAEEPGRADDPRTLAGGRLAVELRPAVGGERDGRVGLDVRLRPSSRRTRSRSRTPRAARRARPRAPCRRRSQPPRPAGRPRRRRRSSTPQRGARGPGDHGSGGASRHDVPRRRGRVRAPRRRRTPRASARPSWPPAPVIRVRRRARRGSASSCSTGGRLGGRSTGLRARPGRRGRTPRSRGSRTGGR